MPISLAIRLAGIDVDGTLVGSSGVVDPRVWDAADEARASGIRLALCSGRPAFGLALEYARRLDPQGWHVFQNGASIVNLATGQSLSVPLPEARVKSVIAEAHENGKLLELYSDNAYVTDSDSDWGRAHAQLLGVPFEARPLESLAGPIVRAQWLLSASDALEMMAVMPADVEVAQSTSPLMPDTRFVGLTNKGVSKGSAMRIVAEAYHVTLQDTMYVGDAGNDLAALRTVGHPVAMGNADPAVIAAAKKIVAHVDSAGLAEALMWASSRQ